MSGSLLSSPAATPLPSTRFYHTLCRAFQEEFMALTSSDPIDITLEAASPEKIRTAVVVVGAFADGSLPTAARKIDEASKGKLSTVIKRGDLDEKAGSSVLLLAVR